MTPYSPGSTYVLRRRIKDRHSDLGIHPLHTLACSRPVRGVEDRDDRRPARLADDRDQPGTFQLIQAPGGREPGEAEIGPILQRQLEFGRSIPTRQEPTDGPKLEGLPGESGGREPPAPRCGPMLHATDVWSLSWPQAGESTMTTKPLSPLLNSFVIMSALTLANTADAKSLTYVVSIDTVTQPGDHPELNPILGELLSVDAVANVTAPARRNCVGGGSRTPISK